MTPCPVSERAATSAEHLLDVRAHQDLLGCGVPENRQRPVGHRGRHEPQQLRPGFVAGELAECQRASQDGAQGLRALPGADRLRAGQHVRAASARGAGERRRGDIRDVGRIDNGQGHVPVGREDPLLSSDGRRPRQGVGREAARAQDRPVQPGFPDALLDLRHGRVRAGTRPGPDSLGRQQDDAAGARGRGRLQQRGHLDVISRARHEQEQRLRPSQGGHQRARRRQVSRDGGDVAVCWRARRAAARDGGHGVARTGEGLDERPADIPGGSGYDDHENSSDVPRPLTRRGLAALSAATVPP